ncbi:TVP38/TMEM64 family protein [Aliihoeflea aestuarii]|uniref:TVP38/TMEM64 family protein n=1 Tax=Aliihoeflea aestuarii TaxID=453840 RepID=UPI002092A7B5|nr:TVP38/TMEM64 family protein [Aliihoeflea aestuarii]MCO6389915.1 TVP38/TMEM64 family protein [Aliihoeflea aestuarii]
MKTARSIWRFLPLIVIAAGLGTAYALGLHDYLTFAELAEQKETLETEVARLGVMAPLLFGLVYMIVTAFALPVAGVLTVFGGFLFGWTTAGVTVAISATIGATLVFLAARSAVGDALRSRVKGRVAALSEGFEDNAFFYLLVLRMTPLFPFFVVNVAPALFKVRLSTYIATTFLGILPGTFTLAFLGQGIDSVLDATNATGRAPTLADIVTPQITLALTGLALLAVLAAALKTYWTHRTTSKASSAD